MRGRDEEVEGIITGEEERERTNRRQKPESERVQEKESENCLTLPTFH